MARALTAAIGAAAAMLDRQRGSLFPWLPVCLGTGIGGYFQLRIEPSVTALILAGCGAVPLALLALRFRAGLGLLALIAAVMLLGFAMAGLRAQSLAAPVLETRIHGPVEGRVVEIDRSASGKLRLTLDRLVLAGMPPQKTPAKVRISVQRDQPWLAPMPGQRLMMTATLAPPEPPVTPGGFDFRRYAWFHQLGGIGFTQTPVLLLTEPAPGELRLAQLRHRLASSIRTELDGQAGAFAAAILTGDYDGLSIETLEALRASNLIHLISISGLHMVLLCGAVFWAVRLGLVLSPRLALNWPVAKIAALAALADGAFYYLLSGGAIPAERAWVMIAVVFVAVLVGRRAISMNSLALAALIVMVLRPESLLDAGFQMSFAATLALVAGMEAAVRRLATWPRWLRQATLAVLASALAGFGSSAFAAAHFNRFADYGLLANLVAAPLMGLVVMPLCVLWMLALPFGLTQIVLRVMGIGIDAVLAVGRGVASLPGATTMVPTPDGMVLPILTLGGLLLALWRGWGRLSALPALLAALILWQNTTKPDIFISPGGGLIGVMTPSGRALSKPSGDAYAAERWLEEDGDGAEQAEAGARSGISRRRGHAEFSYAGLKIVQLTGRGAVASLPKACEVADLVVTTARIKDANCTVWEATSLAGLGGISLQHRSDRLDIRTAQAEAGNRLWTQRGEVKAQELPMPRSQVIATHKGKSSEPEQDPAPRH